MVIIPRTAEECGRRRRQSCTSVRLCGPAQQRRFGRTDLDGNERDDDLLEALRMAARDGLFEELEHVLQDLDARIEQVDPLWDLEVTPRSVVERL